MGLNFNKNPDTGDAKRTVHFGRMNAPTSSSFVKGPCGDEIEFYLVIDEGRIEGVSFYSRGCEDTMSCGEMTSILAEGKTVEEVLKISPGKVLSELGSEGRLSLHCGILAVNSLMRALAEYFLKP